MRLLLDTHAAIWAVADVSRLPGSVRELLQHPTSEVFVSLVTVWEIAIKRSLARYDSPPFSAQRGLDLFIAAGFKILEIRPDHLHQVEYLPMLHRDPFDRLLVVQAMTEPLRLLTHDQRLAAYDPIVMLF